MPRDARVSGSGCNFLSLAFIVQIKIEEIHPSCNYNYQFNWEGIPQVRVSGSIIKCECDEGNDYSRARKGRKEGGVWRNDDNDCP